ncbi:MAG TPA: NADP oxidoreductase [Gammaproteobacteria bacterium]|nr:NADP oxidoreductase [Gammaproteobacteria bacterium]
MNKQIIIDGEVVTYRPGQTLIQAARESGIYIPHLCYQPGYHAIGSCRVCMVKVNGRWASACTTLAAEGQVIDNRTLEVDAHRKQIVQMLFVEGNHYCPYCEKSGECDLQATAYELNMQEDHFQHLYPHRSLDTSHAEVWLDRDRCILCGLCVQASAEQDNKHLFTLGGRGTATQLLVNSSSGQLGETNISAGDEAVAVCPVGALMKKQSIYSRRSGERTYDKTPISKLEFKA